MIHAVYYCVLDSIMQIGIYRYYITLVIIGLMADSSDQYIMYPYRGDIKQFIPVEIRIRRCFFGIFKWNLYRFFYQIQILNLLLIF